MITAGIDIGVENVKVVVLKDEKIVGRGKGRSGGIGRLDAAKAAYERALKEANLKADQVEKVFATGKGKFDLEPIADDIITETITLAKAAEFLDPGATCAYNVGADETMVVTLKKDGRIQEFALNEKCAAGIGSFIRRMARRLEMTQEQMNATPPAAAVSPAINDGCVVFGELDVLALLNKGLSPKEIASAVIFTAVIRASTVIKDLTMPKFDKVLLVGGLSQNEAFVNALKTRLDMEFEIPEEAEYAPALGAALLAANWGYYPYIDKPIPIF